MKGFLIFLVFLLIVGVYLNRAYAYFYNSLGAKILPKTTSEAYDVGLGLNTIKFVSLGDSLTAGVGAGSGEDSYPYLIAKKLSENETDVLLYDLAEPGAESKDVLSLQIDPAISRRPNIVTVLIGINDLHNRVSLDVFKQNYQQIISELKSKTTAKINLISIPYLGSGKILLFPYNILLSYETGVFNQAIKQLALDNSINYIDLYSATKEAFDQDDTLYSEDHFHPSDKGYILWEQVIDANLSY